MGYTHYIRRPKQLDGDDFAKLVVDFKKLLPVFKQMNIPLASWDGKGEPEITETKIAFNGKEDCGHEQRNLGITWPSANAKCVGLAYEKGETEDTTTVTTQLVKAGFGAENIIQNGKNPTINGDGKEALRSNDSDVSGTWFAGCELNTRTCGGDCSHESFVLPLEFEEDFSFCKTAYKPYDFAVNCCLIIAKHHLGDDLVVSSDGELNHWADAMHFCQELLGYGNEFKL